MKTIILSDISNSAETIIPYGLRLARALETEVDILHVIDPRIHQGTYSPEADSKSISPGKTLSPAETIMHEKHRISMKMDILLSSEASRLNYPLKINRVVVKNSLDEELQKRIKKNYECLMVVNAVADEEMLVNTEEIVRLIQKTEVPTIVVPPGFKFKNYMDALIPFNLDRNDYLAIRQLKFLFDNFNMTIDAVGVASNGDYAELELKATVWREMAKKYVLPNSSMKTNILEGKDFVDTITSFIQRNNIDLLMLINSNNRKSVVSETIRFLDSIKSPTLIYFPK